MLQNTHEKSPSFFSTAITGSSAHLAGARDFRRGGVLGFIRIHRNLLRGWFFDHVDCRTSNCRLALHPQVVRLHVTTTESFVAVESAVKTAVHSGRRRNNGLIIGVKGWVVKLMNMNDVLCACLIVELVPCSLPFLLLGLSLAFVLLAVEIKMVT